MALADRIRARYRKEFSRIGETVVIRRYYGSGSPRPKYEKPALARLRSYNSKELVGTIVQGDQEMILLAEDLETGEVIVDGADKYMDSPVFD